MADAITDLWLVCKIGSRAHSDQNRQERVHCSENTVCHKHEAKTGIVSLLSQNHHNKDQI